MFPWINNPGLCSIKGNNRFLDPRHPFPTPASTLFILFFFFPRRGQAPVVKRRTRCAVTIKHYTQRVEAAVVRQVLISHPFPIPPFCLGHLHARRIHSHLRTHTRADPPNTFQFWFRRTYAMEFDLIFHVMLNKPPRHLNNPANLYPINAALYSAAAASVPVRHPRWLAGRHRVLCTQRGRFTSYQTAIAACSSSARLFICLSLAITVIRSLYCKPQKS